jgi:hypothetical protein
LVIAESGGRREDRQRMILEGWRDAIHAGRDAGVHYDGASPSVTHWIRRLARNVRLAAPDFRAEEQLHADEIAALSPAAEDDDARRRDPKRSPEAVPTTGEAVETRACAPASLAPVQVITPEPPTPPEPETAEAAAARERRYRETFGIPEPRRRRPWRRSRTSWPSAM